MSGKLKALFVALLLVSVTLAAGCDNSATQQTPPQSPEAGAQQQAAAVPGSPENMHLTVYYATSDAMNVAPEICIIPKTAQPAKAALELLLQNPKNHELLKVLPEGTKIKSLLIKDHVAYVDFNDKFIKNMGGGSATEILVVGSIVNTLTEFPEILKVQILVEGKKVDTLSGHMDVSEPLSRSEQLIKKSL